MADRNRSVKGKAGKYSAAYYTEGSSARVLAPDRTYGNPARTSVNTAPSEYAFSKREGVLDPLYSFFLVLSVCLFAAGCFINMYTGGILREKEKEVKALQTQLIQVQEKNDALREDMTYSMDLNELYQKATAELGMVYPREDQIVYYEDEGSDFIRQYSEIPEGI